MFAYNEKMMEDIELEPKLVEYLFYAHDAWVNRTKESVEKATIIVGLKTEASECFRELSEKKYVFGIQSGKKPARKTYNTNQRGTILINRLKRERLTIKTKRGYIQANPHALTQFLNTISDDKTSINTIKNEISERYLQDIDELASLLTYHDLLSVEEKEQYSHKPLSKKLLKELEKYEKFFIDLTEIDLTEK